MDRGGLLFAVGLGLIVHVLIGYLPFPNGDDFAYAPLADLNADSSLFPRDDQLRLFENHARVYQWVHDFGAASWGVEPVFRIGVWVLAVLVSVALWSILALLGAPAAALPAVLGLGVVVSLDGLGRGDFGGLVSDFFHHHNVALVLVLGAVALGLARKPWLAGALLGLAVVGQPMTAFHGALAAGLGALLARPADAIKMAVAAVVVSLPAALPILTGLADSPAPPDGLDLVADAYRFRAPHHYDPPMRDLVLTTLYILAGLAGSVLVARRNAAAGRFTLGVMTAFALLHLVSVLVYKLHLAEIPAFFILDANRSSPAAFALGAAFAVAGLWRAEKGPFFAGTVLLLAAILVLNYTPGGIALVMLTGVMIALRGIPYLRIGVTVAIAALLFFVFPPAPKSNAVPEPTLRVLDWIRTETPRDALFVIPVGLYEFRHFAQRSAYVDFKLFSVAQPGQAALTRERMEAVAQPSDTNRPLGGWDGLGYWEADQLEAATCTGMMEMLRDTGADYYLRRSVDFSPAPECPGLETPVRSETLALYALPE